MPFEMLRIPLFTFGVSHVKLWITCWHAKLAEAALDGGVGPQKRERPIPALQAFHAVGHWRIVVHFYSDQLS